MTRIQRVTPEAPVVANGVIPTIREADAIILRNGGTATVHLFYGAYTLAPGETISFNIATESSFVELVDAQVGFDTSTGSIQLLQIITMKSSYC